MTGMLEAVTAKATRTETDRKPVGDGDPDGDHGPAIELSVIISTYNAREVLADCLSSIYQNLPHELYQIIVVDDGSEDSDE